MKVPVVVALVALVGMVGCDTLFGPDGWVQEWSVERLQEGTYINTATFRGLRDRVEFAGVYAIPHQEYELEHELIVAADSFRAIIRAVEQSVPEDSVPAAFAFEMVLGEFESGDSYVFEGRLVGSTEEHEAAAEIGFP